MYFKIRMTVTSSLMIIISLWTLINHSLIQSSQVDLLGKSEMLDGIAVVFDAEGVTPLGGSGGMLPLKILKN